MALLIVDASVVIAFLDDRDASHERAVRALAATSTDDRVLPASVLAEVLVHPNREGGKAVAHVERALSLLAGRVEPLSADIARTAARLRAKHPRLRIADAFVLATGDVLDADVLTADRSLAAIAPRVRLV